MVSHLRDRIHRLLGGTSIERKWSRKENVCLDLESRLIVKVHTSVSILLFSKKIQGNQKVFVRLMVRVHKIRKNMLNSFNHLP
jgi:hypothetical protein